MPPCSNPALNPRPPCHACHAERALRQSCPAGSDLSDRLTPGREQLDTQGARALQAISNANPPSLGRAAQLCALLSLGHVHGCTAVVCVLLPARLVRPLALPWTVLHDFWLCAYVLINALMPVCDMSRGYALVRNAGVGRVRLAHVVCVRNLYDCPGPVLRSNVATGNDSGCFGHPKHTF